MSEDYSEPSVEQKSLIGRLLRWCLENKLIVVLMVVFVFLCGIAVAPFDWEPPFLPRAPVPTDAIPDIGENQQIVFTKWMGRSPQDVQNQITYPLTVSLLGVRGVKSIRSFSMFGFSSIYVIFDEDVTFEQSQWNILVKLRSLPPDALPRGVQPVLGPDATALGQVYWYTLEGRDIDGNPIGGWDLEELRTIQDWTVRYHLLSAGGVAEVASVGGFVREYQVDVDPDAMRAHNVTLPEIYHAVMASNIDVGAKTIELNRVEYFIRGVGFIKKTEDIEDSVVKVVENVPILVKHVATVALGPALRRGALDKDGAEAVGGVVVARYGENPLAAINEVKEKIAKIAPALPAKVIIDESQVDPQELRRFAQAHDFQAYSGDKLDHKAWVTFLRKTPRDNWPAWANISQVTIVSFYDRTGLIYETLGTLNDALSQEILITFIVVILMVIHLRSSMLIGSMLPLAVLLCFIAMKVFGVDANIVALSGIAIAIGTIVDMGIVICENILRHLDEAPPDVPRLEVVHRAASEVGGAVLTAVLTTVVSFLPVFTMIGAEGKLFKPLAFTKTFALLASIVIALTALPPAAHILFCGKISGKTLRRVIFGILAAGAAVLATWGITKGSFPITASGTVLTLFAAYKTVDDLIPKGLARFAPWAASGLVVLMVGLALSMFWEPLGPESGLGGNFGFVALLVGVLLGFFKLFQFVYPWLLRWCLTYKSIMLSLVVVVIVFGLIAWSGMGKEFMPPLDEGSYLYMPTTMTHASIGEALDIVAKQDMAFRNIPEIDSVVGKIGRAETPLDPAPISMIETVINYKPEYKTDKNGRRIKYRYDDKTHRFVRRDGELVEDPDGRPFRQWRKHIKSPDDIWKEIIEAGRIEGTTSAPKLQPIAARIVMLQSGMRAPMGVKVKGPDLETIEQVGLQVERFLKEVPGVEPSAVIADRIVGKPYVEIVPDRKAIARYGVKVREFQDIVEIAIGGRKITTTVEGLARFPVRVRYQRELRDDIEKLGRILIPGKEGTQVPLMEVAEVRYFRGPQVIKSEDTRLVGYVVFDKKPGYAEVDVVEACERYLKEKEASGEFVRPPGVEITFAGSYENQIRAQKTLLWVVPFALFVIFVILYLQFKSIPTSLLVFSGIFVAWSGGFILLWCYSQSWFLNFTVFGVEMREMFQIHPINLSVAVWVGFLALFGIATDDGVIQSTYLDQVFRDRNPATVSAIRDATVTASKRRVRPCLMTSATTILALIPILTSTGRGSDVMVPMAIPSFGGMLVVMVSIFVVPTLYCLVKEFIKHTGWPDWLVGLLMFFTAFLAIIPMLIYCAIKEFVLLANGAEAGSDNTEAT